MRSKPKHEPAGRGETPRRDKAPRDPLEVAYTYLNRRDRTAAEVRARLEREGIETQAIDDTLKALKEHGTLDDVRYARLFTEDKRSLEDWGSDRIRRELIARGIDRDLIEDVLYPGEGPTEPERALMLLRRRFPAPLDRRDRDRAFGVLVRKGFDSELAADALSRHARCEQPDA